MDIKVPAIDKRDADALLSEIAALAPFYTPEWSPDKEDAGYGLSRVFSHLMESAIERLNRVPEKNFIAYLDRLGLRLLPAQPATAPVTFAVSERTKENVPVPQQTRIASKDIVFETERSIVATPSKLVKAYSVNAAEDGIYESPGDAISGVVSRKAVTSLLHAACATDGTISLVNAEGFRKGDMLIIGICKEYAIVSDLSDSAVTLVHQLEGGHPAGSTVAKTTSFSLFDGKNLQEHILYLGHDDNLKLNGRACILVRTGPSAGSLSDKTRVEWEYWGDDTDRQTGWHRLNLRQDYPSECELFHGESKGKLDLSEEWPGTVEFFLEKDSGEMKRLKIHGKESFWIRCRVKKQLLTRDPLSRIRIDFIALAPVPWFGIGKDRKGIAAEAAFSNDIPLNTDLDTNGNLNSSVYPFGRLPRIYDTFYIASSEAFSKRGSEITLSFDLRDTATVPIKKVQGIGSVYTNRLKEAGISTVEELMRHSPEELMRILKTEKKNIVANIIEAARKSYFDKGSASKIAGGARQADEEKPCMSYEYWNGKAWSALKGLKDNTAGFLNKGAGTVEFICPPDISQVKVNGLENFWIRTRLVGGSYGRERFVKDPSNTEVWISDTGGVAPPLIDSLTVYYSMRPQPLQYCVSLNNLAFEDLPEESRSSDSRSFTPFFGMEDSHQTVYLGFDRKPEKGPVSLFFYLEEQFWGDTLPVIEWEYYAGGGTWTRIERSDETRGLTRSGTIEFMFPKDLTSLNRFGTELYWIRAVDVKDLFKPAAIVYEQTYREFEQSKPGRGFVKKFLKSIPNPERTTCPEILDIFHPQWIRPADIGREVPSPRINNIFVNTTWAVQSESIKDEILGSSGGSASQSFTLKKNPVITEEIWINEIGLHSEEQRKRLIESGEFRIEEKKDERGSTKEFWVRWRQSEDILLSSSSDRTYEIDGNSGSLIFGDGVHGLLPPIGTDNIKANYSTGGGSKGNLAAREIKDLKTSLPNIDKAFNPIPADGGSDSESMEELMERGPMVIKHRGRAVTVEDFEQMAHEASQAVAKARCIPDFDNQGSLSPGWITVVVLPHSSDRRPRLSLQLKNIVEKYLLMRAPAVVAGKGRLQVSEPVYVEIAVGATVVAVSADAAAALEDKISSLLAGFLDPFTGSPEKKGWNFGEMPCFSDFYALLEGLTEVDHVDSLALDLATYAHDQLMSTIRISPDSPAEIRLPDHAVVCSGQHAVDVTFKTAKSA
jgi:hypothetical protein